MPAQTTARLELPILLEGQARKHITHNEALDRLDLLVQCVVLSRQTSVEPSAQDGDIYILPPDKSGGSWAGMAVNALAGLIEGYWLEIQPRPGWIVFVEDEGVGLVFADGAWRPLAQDRVDRTGDTMTGPLALPADGLQVGLGQVTAAAGNVGINRTSPAYPLHVGRQGVDSAAVGPDYNGGVPVDVGDVRLSVFAWSGAPEIYICRNNVNAGSLSVSEGGDFVMGISGVARVVVGFDGALRPAVANATSCGSSEHPWSAIYSQSGVITTSDRRAKADISPSPLGLDFIRALNPVGYRFVDGGCSTAAPHIVEGRPVAQPFVARAGSRLHTGFVAQQVQAILPDGLDWAGWTRSDPGDPDSRQGLRYEELIAPVVAAIQQIADRLDRLEARDRRP